MSEIRNTDGVSDERLMVAWRNGLDTYEIAKKFGMFESRVAYRLWQIRETQRRTRLQEQQQK